MSIVNVDTTGGKLEATLMRCNYDEKTKKVLDVPSRYSPSEEDKKMRSLVLKHFALGNVTMFKPRVEFNDLSVIMRDQVDKLAMNTYQPNNGQPIDGDVNSWRSNAIRPIVRNKAISIAAHATARLIFPKIFAFNDQSDEQADAAQIMSDLMEWAGHQSNYDYYSLNRVMEALASPASIGYTEYAEVYRNVKTEKDSNGKWIEEPRLDTDMSGFRDEVVPVDQLYIENFYEADIQKQGWLILRKVIGFDLAHAKYHSYPNFQYVQPGVQILFNDANQLWYSVYDTNMRQEEVEEITYWNKNLDVKIVLVNGVMMTEWDCPNPRNDKRYPFDKFGYQIINSRCFYYKSLSFYLQSDAGIVNTLYPMIIDGTYLSIMKPMVNVGADIISSNVMIPGAVTTLSDPNASLRPIDSQIDLRSGMNTLQKVEESISESSNSNIQSGVDQGGDVTAFQISKMEQNASTILGLFVKMISEHVRQYGDLRKEDILQYLTIPEVTKITDDAPLVYKTFLMPDKHAAGRTKSRKIKFDSELPDKPISQEEYLKMSYGILEEQGGEGAKQELWKANPRLFRENKYMITVSPDVMNPMSEELERAFGLEEWDRMIAHPEIYDPEESGKLLLDLYPKTRRNPQKFIKKAESNPMAQLEPGTKPLNNQPGIANQIQSAQPRTPIAPQVGSSII